jgi:SAM-dependent methyltransferase
MAKSAKTLQWRGYQIFIVGLCTMLQAQTEWYENWFGSPYYKALYEQHDDLEARAFVKKLVEHLSPLPKSSMLDIACGEGRYAIQLADYGFDVTGIDLSHRNIEKAKLHEAENLHFYVQDMRFPFYINYFDYAFNFFTSFGYFGRNRDHMMAAKSFASGLKKNGLLVIDYLNKDHTLENLVEDDTINRGGYTFHVKRRLEAEHFIKEIEFTDNEGKARHCSESVAAFTLSDFIRMFKEAQLSLVGTFGDYSLNTYHPTDSPRMIMIFKK